jgi:hypothetical protein
MQDDISATDVISKAVVTNAKTELAFAGRDVDELADISASREVKRICLE